MTVIWREPRRPTWLYPVGTRIRTRFAEFVSVSNCEYEDCRFHGTWEPVEAEGQ